MTRHKRSSPPPRRKIGSKLVTDLSRTDLDKETISKAYARWAPVYDLVFGKVFEHGRQSTIAEADKIGGRILDVGVGTGLSSITTAQKLSARGMA